NAIQDVRAVAGLAPLVATDPIPLDPAPATTPAPAEPAASVPAAAPATPTPAPSHRTAPRLSRLVAAPATAIVCGPGASGCHTRAAQLLFRADQAATVTAQVQRRSCAHGRCAYRTAATVTVGAK